MSAPVHRVCQHCLSLLQVCKTGSVLHFGECDGDEVYKPGWVECIECGATGPVVNVLDGDQPAWDAWNHRPKIKKRER